jgi:hypothetical protein
MMIESLSLRLWGSTTTTPSTTAIGGGAKPTGKDGGGSSSALSLFARAGMKEVVVLTTAAIGLTSLVVYGTLI